MPMAREIIFRGVGIPLHPPRRPVARLGTTIAVLARSLLVFEPAHFIMEQGMLRGIKQRTEARHSL